MKRLISLLLANLLLLSTFAGAHACCSVWPARFENTKGYAGEAMKDGKLVHLLAYQNTAQNLAPSGGNAMLLPIPAVAGTMTKNNILDTSGCSSFLDDMERAINPPPPPGSRGDLQTEGIPQSAGTVEVFNHDIYTIVLAQNANDIPAALAKVPERKRPKMNPEIFGAYQKWYKGWTFALCCFDNADMAKAKPMLWWYLPQNKNELFFPALDAHTGHAPDLNASVAVDHTICASTLKLQNDGNGTKVSYSDGVFLKNVTPLLPHRIVGQIMRGRMRNGDFVFKVADVDNGQSNSTRTPPPGARL